MNASKIVIAGLMENEAIRPNVGLNENLAREPVQLIASLLILTVPSITRLRPCRLPL